MSSSIRNCAADGCNTPKVLRGYCLAHQSLASNNNNNNNTASIATNSASSSPVTGGYSKPLPTPSPAVLAAAAAACNNPDEPDNNSISINNNSKFSPVSSPVASPVAAAAPPPPIPFRKHSQAQQPPPSTLLTITSVSSPSNSNSTEESDSFSIGTTSISSVSSVNHSRTGSRLPPPLPQPSPPAVPAMPTAAATAPSPIGGSASLGLFNNSINTTVRGPPPAIPARNSGSFNINSQSSPVSSNSSFNFNNSLKSPISSSNRPNTPLTPSNNNNGNLRRENIHSMSQLTHIPDQISDQTDSGLYTAKRIGNCMKKLSELESEYSRNILKLLEFEFAKMKKLDSDHMAQAHSAWRDTQLIIRELAQYHQSQSQRVMVEVAVPLLEFHTSGTVKRNELAADERNITKSMAIQHGAVSNELDTCQKLLIQATAQANKGSTVPGGSISSPSGSLINNNNNSSSSDLNKQSSKLEQAKSLASRFANKVASKVAKEFKEFTLLSPEALREKIYAASKKYQLTIESANNHQYNYLNTELPRVLGSYESLERTRLTTVSQALNNYSNLIRANIPAIADNLNKYPIANNLLSVDTDISRLIETFVQVHGPTPTAINYVYSLPCSPDDISRGQYTGSPTSIFHTTLNHCMKLQSTTTPGLTVPRIVPSLIQCIRSQSGGVSSEGIFRISPSKSELDILRAQLEKQDYSMNGISVHTAAAMLKEWMRLLAEPLIPIKLYQTAIDTATADQSTATANNSSYSSINAALNVFNQLDSVNREVLLSIADIASEILLPENVKTNRMSIDALAIVFAPCWIRTTSTDPMIILANVKLETRFTTMLLKALIQQHNSNSNNSTAANIR